ncbi:hypothetical protein [Alicyclobacillus sp. ALC3]|uniref:hypothetical protein n=1 Tax=Alicyclobacillus sp. ALC3 TaxID=2796143 RepID=UPI002379F70C|nr:hypothetical protein [Alicyclobacillus sp. ALC3]WDL99116.1 hypothetical protein JC200_10975 [Alicyclobacillus sp. ALC3]
MVTYWTMVFSLGLVVMFGFGILKLYTKLEKLAHEDAPPVAASTGSAMNRRDTPFSLTVSRRTMQSALGVMWLLDGIFQLKPQMFSQAFIQQVILPTSDGQPVWISTMIHWGAHVVAGNLVVWNSLFALVQLALGVALMFNVKVRQTIVASLIWSGIVWIFGEGTGQLLTGQTLLLNGAPGAVVIYALVGIAVFPKKGRNSREWQGSSVRFAQVSLAGLLALGFVLHLQPVYLTAGGLRQAIMVPWLAQALNSHGAVYSVVLGCIELALAIMLFFRIRLRVAVWLSIVLFTLYWWVGQSFGQIQDPLATDFNSGLLLVLLAICANPELLGHLQSNRECLEGDPA